MACRADALIQLARARRIHVRDLRLDLAHLTPLLQLLDLLPLLFLKRLSDVFDDEMARLAEDYGDRDTALEIAEGDHSLLRFYLPLEARWGAISGREAIQWPLGDKGLR